MNEKDKEKIELVITHCEMFLYGFSQQFPLFPTARKDIIANLYNIFAGMHLISTMFLLKDEGEEKGKGACRRLLQDLKLDYLLEPIQKIMITPLGKTTFGDYIRRSRAKLATHGDLSFSSLKEEEQDITYDPQKVSEFQNLMLQLAEEVKILKGKLEKAIK